MFIAFEGLDGSGSTTQSKLLVKRLEEAGHPAIHTKEPTDGTPIGKLIREALQHQWSCSSEGLQLLFSADRAEHLKQVIQPALENEKIVVTDRYMMSTLAYGGLSVEMDWLKELNKKFIQPELTLLFKLDPEICIERIHKRGDAFELFEEKEKLEMIWKQYEKASLHFKNVHVMDANRPIEAISKEVWSIVHPLI